MVIRVALGAQFYLFYIIPHDSSLIWTLVTIKSTSLMRVHALGTAALRRYLL